MVQQAKADEKTLEELEGIRPSVLKKLESEGIYTARDILERGKEGLLAIAGIGEKTAEQLLELVEE